MEFNYFLIRLETIGLFEGLLVFISESKISIFLEVIFHPIVSYAIQSIALHNITSIAYTCRYIHTKQ